MLCLDQWQILWSPEKGMLMLWLIKTIYNVWIYTDGFYSDVWMHDYNDFRYLSRSMNEWLFIMICFLLIEWMIVMFLFLYRWILLGDTMMQVTMWSSVCQWLSRSQCCHGAWLNMKTAFPLLENSNMSMKQ
mgnify:CR=1 FL=1